MQDGLILCRFVHFGAVLLLFGIGLFRSVLFPRLLRAFEVQPARHRLDRGLLWLGWVSLVSAAGWLMLTAANLYDQWQAALAPNALWTVLGNTFFGHVWIVHLVLNVLAVVGSMLLKARSPLVLLSLQSLLLLTLAPVGHGAMFDGMRGYLLILNQMLHLAGVATWLGAMAMLAVLLDTRHSVDMSKVLRRFSGMGYALVAVVIVTGLINVRALSGRFWPDPAFSGFGLVLAVKALMVLCMLALAAFNRHLAHAAAFRPAVLRISVLLECLFGAAALAAVSLLGTLAPMLA